MMRICPRCQQRVVTSNDNTDIIHECHGDTVLSREDVPVIGQWEDYTGSGAALAPGMVLQQGGVNTVAGTEAALYGAKISDLGERGKRVGTHRTRRHEEYVEFK